MKKQQQLATVTKPYTDAKIVERNTLKIDYADGTTGYRLHSTDVVTRGKDGSFTLNSGGWRTPTTKERINLFFPYRISQERGLWYVHTPTGTFDFYDGIKFNADGTLKGKQKRVNTAKIDKQKKQIAKFVDKVTKDNVPIPSAGDCWDCAFKTEDGNPMGDLSGSDHLAKHVKEGYLHGSLIVNALKAAGYSDAGIHLMITAKHVSTIKRSLKKYLTKHLIKNIAS